LLLPIHVLKYTNGHISPNKQGFDAKLNLPKLLLPFFYHPHLLEATQHTISKELKNHSSLQLTQSFSCHEVDV
jgi:hypothetical protein